MTTASDSTYRGGWRTAIAYVVAFPLAVFGTAYLTRAPDFVSELPVGATIAIEQTHFAVLALLTAFVLRREGVRLSSIGLSMGHLRSALIVFAAIWGVLNLLGIGIAEATGQEWGLELLWETQPEPIVIAALLQFFVVGLVEEFAIRGYLQSKLIALYGDETRLDVALGILSAALFFGLAHVPQGVLGGASPRGLVLGVTVLTISGALFGLLYELTRNVFLVGWLHALGNTWILVVDWWSWTGVAFAGFSLGLFVVYFAGVLGYRRWTLGTDLSPTGQRLDGGSEAGSP